MEGSSVIIMAPPHPSNPVHHFPELCTTCAARFQRQQVQRSHSSWSASSTDSSSEHEHTNLESRLAAEEDSLNAPPPPYTRHPRRQRIETEPPAYIDLLPQIPVGACIKDIPVTLRYTETLVLEDDGWAKVVCPTARKYKAIVKVYDSMDWETFQQRLKRIKPAVTMREGGLKDVKALRPKGKWEKVVGTRLTGARVNSESWQQVRREVCKGQMDKIVVYV